MSRALPHGAICLLLPIVLGLLPALPAAAQGDSPLPLPAEPEVRVRIIHTLGSVAAITTGAYALLAPDGTSTEVTDGTEVVWTSVENGVECVLTAPTGDSAQMPQAALWTLVPSDEASTLLIRDVPYGVGWWWESKQDRRYEGRIEVSPKITGTLDVIAILPVEEYLRGVVPSEIGGGAPEEAMKAQAVAARSETMTALLERTYAGPNFDICADVDCQVFSGTGKRTEATDAAIRATRGIVLTFGGKPIPAYYASNSGGYTENVGNVWPQRERGIPCWTGTFDGPGEGPKDLMTEEGVRAWIDARPEVFSNPDFHPGLPDWTKKNFRWEVVTDAATLSARVATIQDIGTVTAIEPIDRGPSGRLIKVRFVGTTGSVEVGPELSIRQVWAPPLKSSAFYVEAEGEGFRIKGAGYGHGVGMCQTGAMARALAGQDYPAILSHYYQQSVLLPAYK